MNVCQLQGQHINDAQVLREIGRAAKLEDPDRVADDPECCAAEVSLTLCSWARHIVEQQNHLVFETTLHIFSDAL